MPTMKSPINSDYSVPNSMSTGIAGEITATFLRLRALLREEAIFWRLLDDLFVKQKEEAEEAAQTALEKLGLVTDEQIKMGEMLNQEIPFVRNALLDI